MREKEGTERDGKEGKGIGVKEKEKTEILFSFQIFPRMKGFGC